MCLPVLTIYNQQGMGGFILVRQTPPRSVHPRMVRYGGIDLLRGQRLQTEVRLSVTLPTTRTPGDRRGQFHKNIKHLKLILRIEFINVYNSNSQVRWASG